MKPLPGQPVGAGEPLLDLDQADPRPVGALGVLDADDPVEAAERVLRVGQPVAVVAVVDVVVAERRRHLVRREGPGCDAVALRLPVAGGVGAVQDRQAERLVDGAEHVAACGELVRHVGDRALHRVVGLAAAVGGDRVDPGDALVLALDPVVLTHGLRLVVVVEVVQVAEVGRVDVAQREADALRPRQRDPDEAVDHRPVLGRVDRAAALLGPAVGLRVDGDLGRLHRLDLAVDDVAVRIARRQGQGEGREAPGRGDRVRPGEPARVPDQDQRHAVEGAALDVELAGDLQVRLVEPLGSVPREVRVAEHEPAAVLGRLRAEAVGVRADLRLQALEAPCRSRACARAWRRRPPPAAARPARRRRCRRGRRPRRRGSRAGRSGGRRPSR